MRPADRARRRRGAERRRRPAVWSRTARNRRRFRPGSRIGCKKASALTYAIPFERVPATKMQLLGKSGDSQRKTTGGRKAELRSDGRPPAGWQAEACPTIFLSPGVAAGARGRAQSTYANAVCGHSAGGVGGGAAGGQESGRLRDRRSE